MRLVVFGCSFTDYSWPTWADIIADDLGCDYENWAVGGGGNQLIARRALYRWCRGFDPQDLVMIQWTSISREDRWHDGRWIAEGSVALSPTYRKHFVYRYWDPENDVINTAQARIGTEQLLGDLIQYQMEMQWREPGPVPEYSGRIYDYWRKKIPPQDEVPADCRPWDGRTRDGHPTPLWWLQWVESRIYPRFGWQIRPETRRRVEELQSYMDDLVEQGLAHRDIQQKANIRSHELGWRFNKCKPGSDALNPGQGSDILI